MLVGLDINLFQQFSTILLLEVVRVIPSIRLDLRYVKHSIQISVHLYKPRIIINYHYRKTVLAKQHKHHAPIYRK